MIEHTLINFIDTLDASFKKILESTGDSLNITSSQAQYIEAIYRLGEPTLSELADVLGITKASVTVAINKLLEGGYVVKTPSQHDKRAVHVKLTKASEKLIHAKQKALKTYGAFVGKVLTKRELKDFEAVMNKIIEAFYQSKLEN